MEFFRGVNVNWLGWKWYFLAFSMIFSVAGIVKMSWNWSHIGTPVPLSVDFRGGTEVQVQFANRPDIDAIRQAMEAAGIKDARIQNFDVPSMNEVLISLPRQSDETSLDTGRQQIVDALHAHYSNPFNVRSKWIASAPRSATSWRRRPRAPFSGPCSACWSISGSASS